MAPAPLSIAVPQANYRRRTSSRHCHQHADAGVNGSTTKPVNSTLQTRLYLRIAFLLVAATAGPVLAQQPVDSAITVAPKFDGGHFVAGQSPIELTLSRWPSAAEGRLALFVGSADLTTLFERTGEGLVFRADGYSLPSGENELKAFLVTGSVWKELGRFPIRVLTPRGFEKAQVDPGVELSNKGQLAEGHSGSSPAPARATYQDFGTTLSLQTNHLKDAWSVKSQLHLLGMSRQEETLRFGEKGDQASPVDLADFLVVAAHGGTTLSLGHVSAGGNRLLINNFSSRGLTAVFAGARASASVAAQNGTSIVGVDNIVGLSNPDHRVLSATVGVELVPAARGILHVDATAIAGSLQPLTGVSQGGIVSTERSDGFGVQIAASTPGQRVRFAGGFASSKFENPPDPSLSGNLSASPSPAGRKNARFAELDVAIFRDVRAWDSLAVNLNGAFRYERTDPLYRSVATFTQADLSRSTFELNGGVDVITMQATYTESKDNLDRVTAMQQAMTQASGAVVSAPLAALLRATTKAAWLPVVSYGRQQSHQFGTGLAANASFAPSDIPDQLNLVQDVTAQWQVGAWQLGYHFSHATQDNRQPGREKSDFTADIHGISAAVTTPSHVDLGVQLNLEQNDNLEFMQRSLLQRVNVTARWNANPLLTLDGAISVSANADDGAGHDTRVSEIRAGAAQSFTLWQTRDNTPNGQLFLRFSTQSSRLNQYGLPLLPPPSQSGAMWFVSSGLTLRVF